MMTPEEFAAETVNSRVWYAICPDTDRIIVRTLSRSRVLNEARSYASEQGRDVDVFHKTGLDGNWIRFVTFAAE